MNHRKLDANQADDDPAEKWQLLEELTVFRKKAAVLAFIAFRHSGGLSGSEQQAAQQKEGTPCENEIGL